MRHVRMEVPRVRGRMPKPKLMVPLIVHVLPLLVEDHKRKLQRASFLTLKAGPLAGEVDGYII